MVKSYIFELKNVDFDRVNEKYGIKKERFNIPRNVSKISDLIDCDIKNTISFYDELKNKHSCIISMIDFKTETRLDTSKKYHCFWDRHPIPENVYPIGCPVNYQPNKMIRTYYSVISKDIYTIKENLTELQSRKCKNTENDIINEPYYVVDGIFCSFNCCHAFIEENYKNPLYELSNTLLYKMYRDINGVDIKKITKAPSWRTLKVYGGTLTIEEFRENFNSNGFSYQGKIEPRSIGYLYEKELKFA